MSFAEFAGNHPWALTILRSELLLKMIELLETERSIEELLVALSPLTKEDIERALHALMALGVVKQVDSKYTLSEVGREFLKVYRETF